MKKEKHNTGTLEKVVALAKRRGFVYPGSEIYGGLAGFYDWGHLGVKLVWNIEWAWWRDTVQLRDDVVGLDAALVMHPKAWEASGHVSGFSDPLIECKNCNKMYRIDELADADLERYIKKTLSGIEQSNNLKGKGIEEEFIPRRLAGISCLTCST